MLARPLVCLAALAFAGLTTSTGPPPGRGGTQGRSTLTGAKIAAAHVAGRAQGGA